MVDFVKFLQIGINAAGIAEKNKNEIAGVFKELNRQLNDGLGGQIQIMANSLDSEANQIMSSIFTLLGKDAIFAFNPQKSEKNPEKLARWRMNANGYPCHIILQDQEISCEDRQAL
ncbi:MAG: hypothetical protein RL748_1156, partial [Pseudomonadota bacterium]